MSYVPSPSSPLDLSVQAPEVYRRWPVPNYRSTLRHIQTKKYEQETAVILCQIVSQRLCLLARRIDVWTEFAA